MVAGVGDNDLVARPVKADGMGRRKLPVAGAARAELEHGRAVGLQHLHAIVARVGDGKQAVARDCHALRRCKLAGGGALLPEHESRRAVDVENVDAMVARVGNGDQVALRRERDGRGACKLPDGGALRPEGAGECTVRIEHLYAMVAGVGNGDQAGGAYRGALGRHELAGAVAARPNVKGVGAARAKHADAIVGGVGDDDGARQQGNRHCCRLCMNRIPAAAAHRRHGGEHGHCGGRDEKGKGRGSVHGEDARPLTYKDSIPFTARPQAPPLPPSAGGVCVESTGGGGLTGGWVAAIRDRHGRPRMSYMCKTFGPAAGNGALGRPPMHCPRMTCASGTRAGRTDWLPSPRSRLRPRRREHHRSAAGCPALSGPARTVRHVLHV